MWKVSKRRLWMREHHRLSLILWLHRSYLLRCEEISKWSIDFVVYKRGAKEILGVSYYAVVQARSVTCELHLEAGGWKWRVWKSQRKGDDLSCLVPARWVQQWNDWLRLRQIMLPFIQLRWYQNPDIDTTKIPSITLENARQWDGRDELDFIANEPLQSQISINHQCQKIEDHRHLCSLYRCYWYFQFPKLDSNRW